VLIQRVQSLGEAEGNWVVGLSTRAQRFEYDFAGVVIGPDLVWRGDRWQANPTASADTQVRRAANFDVLVRNVYKVLLTRGWSAASSIPPTLKPERFLQNSVFRPRSENVKRSMPIPGVREVGQGCHRPSVGCRGC
jgi:hypothetical protein